MKSKMAPVAFTAYRVMFHVALEQYQPKDRRLIHDDLARRMLPRRLQLRLAALGFSPLRRGFLALLERGFPSTRSLLCRKRYIDDTLLAALGDTFDAVVILGSGLDTRAYRLPRLSTLPVYEVDLPETIAYKEERLRQLLGTVPSHVKLIPIDFDRQSLADVLRDHGYRFEQRSFIIWEGVTQYISESAVRAVFEALAGVRPGSRILFSYIAKDFIDGGRTHGLDRLYRQTRTMWRFGLEPSQVAVFIGEYSWKELEQTGADEYRRRYLEPLGRTDSTLEIERIVYAEKGT